MIKDSIIDDIRNLPAEQVIGYYISLKKAGVNYKACCPFHNEKTPSFTVSPAKGMFHCFGCGEGGSVIDFVMKHKNLGFTEAVKEICKNEHIPIEYEDMPPDWEEKQKELEQHYHFNEFAANYYHKQIENTENAEAAKYLLSRFSRETIDQWRIGIADIGGNELVQAARIAGYREDFYTTTGLIRYNERTKKPQDFFFHRIVFPIRNKNGRIAGFTGRKIPGTDPENKFPKYINLADTLTYQKSISLFGIDRASASIRKKNEANLVEGNPDVVTMHQNGIINTIAPCGTALTDKQAKIIKSIADRVMLIYDGDPAGAKATHKNAEICINAGLNVFTATLPNDEDPDTFFTSRDKFDKFIKAERKDYISFLAAMKLKKDNDPLTQHQGIVDICRLLKKLPEAQQSMYIETLSRQHKVPKKSFTEEIRDLEQSTVEVSRNDDIPEEVDPNFVNRWGFYAYQNEYYFEVKGVAVRKSNFIMEPVFHIDDVVNSRRVFRLVNYKGYRTTVELDMQEMTSIQSMRKNVEGKGNFLFWGTDQEWNRLKLYLYEETRTCHEIKFLGWQKEGFWAWSNGKVTDEGFENVDEDGIIKHKRDNYFIPAFSKIYIKDESVFINERKFLFRVREDVTMKRWADLFVKVFEDNAKIGIAYWTATLFRDYILHTFKNFPLLNLFGPKGTGKSQMAVSLCSLFGPYQTPFNIHNGTKPGLADHVQQFCNAFAWIDEYKNAIEYDKIETLKSIYDSIGRSRMNMDKGRKKETTLVNAAVILSGQEMPTADVALFSRVVFLQFMKTTYNDEEKKWFDQLKSIERDGLACLSNQIIRLRKIFERDYFNEYMQVLSDFGEKLRSRKIEDRILRSYCTILGSYKLVNKYIDFGFTYSDVEKACMRAAIEQNQQIGSSNEIGKFWDMFEALFNDDVIIAGWHFKIKLTEEIIEKDNKKNLPQPTQVLFFKFTSIVKIYAEHMRRGGEKPLPSDTLKYYLRNEPAFLGISKSVSYSREVFEPGNGNIEKRQVTTGFAFDYHALSINLERDESIPAPKLLDTDDTVEETQKDDAPF